MRDTGNFRTGLTPAGWRIVRMRLNGQATISLEDPLMAEYPEAQFI